MTGPRRRDPRPVVGVTIAFSYREPEWFALRDDYVRAVELAGGLPIVLCPGQASDARTIVDRHISHR